LVFKTSIFAQIFDKKSLKIALIKTGKIRKNREKFIIDKRYNLKTQYNFLNFFWQFYKLCLKAFMVAFDSLEDNIELVASIRLEYNFSIKTYFIGIWASSWHVFFCFFYFFDFFYFLFAPFSFKCVSRST